jgi:hypothetical protein
MKKMAGRESWHSFFRHLHRKRISKTSFRLLQHCRRITETFSRVLLLSRRIYETFSRLLHWKKNFLLLGFRQVYIRWVLLRPSQYWYANCKSCLRKADCAHLITKSSINKCAWWTFGCVQKEIRDSSSCHETTYIEAENVIRSVCWIPLPYLELVIDSLINPRIINPEHQ